MLLDGRHVPNGKEIDTDICIIGAGAAGLSIARELEGTKINVVLLESGGLEFDGKTQELYEGDPEEIGLESTRMRYLGGSTNCWHGRCRPLDVSDFHKREWVANSGWPISLDELVPYYNRAGELLKIWAYKDFLSTDWDKNLFPGQYFMPLKTPGSRLQGSPFAQSTEPHNRFGSRFLDLLKASQNVSTYLHSNLISLNANKAATRINTVTAATLEGSQFKIRSKIIILALGGIENPRLLLASNDIEVAGIGNRYDRVGRYFMGHTFVDLGKILYGLDDHCFTKELIPAPLGQLSFKLNDNVIENEQLLNAGIWVSRHQSDGEWAFREVRRDLFRGRFPDSLGTKLLNMFDDFGDVSNAAVCNLQGKRNRPSSWDFWLQGEQVPDPENRLYLGRKTDALGMKRISVKRFYNDLEKQTALKTAEIFAAEVTRLGIGRVKLDGSHLESELFRKNNTQKDLWFGHDMGTTRMSNNPKAGVVDQNCKVYGMDNLYIAGSSVFPTSGFANPTMTIIALAIRMTDKVKSRLS